MSAFENLFNPKGVTEQPVRGNTEQYKVSYKDGKNGVYKSVIRFIPNYADTSKNIMSKNVSFVKNPTTQKGMYVDDPRSIGEYSPVTDMFFKLRNTGIAAYVDYAKTYLGSKQQYASLVQIVSDEQHPELVGQIKVFVYGKKIWEKLHNEEYPQGAGQGINPFHPIYGRKFSLVCVESAGYPNYDQSNFYDERNGNQILPSGMWYIDPANSNQFAVVDENTDGDILMEYLKANSPDLSKYDYHEWTEEQTKHVQEVLNISMNYMTTGTLQNVQQSQFQIGMAAVNGNPQPVAAPAAPAPAFNPTPTFPGATPAAAPVSPAPATPVAPTAGGFVPPVPSVPATPAPAVPGTATPPVGATVPNVTSKSAPTAAPAVQGMNMDDVLKNL